MAFNLSEAVIIASLGEWEDSQLQSQEHHHGLTVADLVASVFFLCNGAVGSSFPESGVGQLLKPHPRAQRHGAWRRQQRYHLTKTH